MRSRCLAVPRKEAEEARRRLLARGLLRRDLQVRGEGGTVLLPLADGTVDAGAGELRECDFQPSRARPRTYREVAGVPEELRRLLPRAHDVIGKVILLKLPEELVPFRREIGRALLEARPEAASAAWDRGVKGGERVRDLEVIAGREDLETVHLEHGLRFLLDPSKVYFSPRLATERLRVARMVREGEVVADLFAGVGPFSITVAKLARPAAVLAVDINPRAVEYLRRNLALNRVSGVTVIGGDAREVAPRLPPCDREIMNLPHGAAGFLPEALGVLKPGGTVHLYEVLPRERLPARKEELMTLVECRGRKVSSLSARLVRGYSASDSHVAFDITVA